MKYKLETTDHSRPKRSLRESAKKYGPMFATEKGHFIGALAAIVCSSLATLVAPVLIVRIIDNDIRLKNMHGLIVSSLIVLAIYMTGAIASYIQVNTMGGVGRRVLFHLRNALFLKLQDLPVAFFNENKAGDLISRLNNDTDKLNQFVSQALMQFVGSTVLITGAAIFLVSLSVKLGLAALMPAFGVLILTRGTSAWIKRKNMRSLQALGGMSWKFRKA